MVNFNLIASVFYIALGSGILGYALGHIQVALMNDNS